MNFNSKLTTNIFGSYSINLAYLIYILQKILIIILEFSIRKIEYRKIIFTSFYECYLREF